jgi:hypothetical protein
MAIDGLGKQFAGYHDRAVKFKLAKGVLRLGRTMGNSFSDDTIESAFAIVR